MRRAPTARKSRASKAKKSTGEPERYVPYDFEEEEIQPAVRELRPMLEKDRSRSFQFYYTLGKNVIKHYNASPRRGRSTARACTASGSSSD